MEGTFHVAYVYWRDPSLLLSHHLFSGPPIFLVLVVISYWDGLFKLSTLLFMVMGLKMEEDPTPISEHVAYLILHPWTKSMFPTPSIGNVQIEPGITQEQEQLR